LIPFSSFSRQRAIALRSDSSSAFHIHALVEKEEEMAEEQRQLEEKKRQKEQKKQQKRPPLVWSSQDAKHI